jgi:hypothetical protein
MEASMSHNPEHRSRFGTPIFWCGLAVACLGLFAAVSGYSPLRGKLGGPYGSYAIVNAISLDAPPEMIDPQRPPSHQRDMRELRHRVKALEKELAALKRQNQTPDH